MEDIMLKTIKTFPSKRPFFSDKQCLSFEDITPGYYVVHNRHLESSVFITTRPFYDKELERWAVDLIRVGVDRVITIPLEELSIYPYEITNTWMPFCWLEKI